METTSRYLDDDFEAANGGGRTLPLSDKRKHGCDGHFAERPVATIVGVTLYGAQRAKVEAALARPELDFHKRKALVLNASGIEIKRPVAPRSKFDLSKHVPVLEEVLIEGPDFKTPALEASFWPAVWRIATKNKFRNIVACCLGGHGRTGTALACLLVARGYTAKDAIAHVRKAHCPSAVETDDQRLYVAWVEKELARTQRRRWA